MRFEWDDLKAALNERKHGLSFAEAMTIFGRWTEWRGVSTPKLTRASCGSSDWLMMWRRHFRMRLL